MYSTKSRRHGSELFPQIETVLNEIFNTTISHATDSSRKNYSQPSANVKEFKDRFEIHLAVPGMEKSDIAVKVDKNTLIISANQENEQDSKFKLKEYNYGVFSRKFKLPQTVDTSSVDATLASGILTISISKREEEIDKGPKEILVK